MENVQEEYTKLKAKYSKLNQELEQFKELFVKQDELISKQYIARNSDISKEILDMLEFKPNFVVKLIITKDNQDIVIKELPKLTFLTHLECALSNVKDISNLTNLTYLDCNHCPLISNINQLINLTTLICNDCPLIDNVYNLSKLTTLVCDSCPLINSVHTLTNLTRLDCYECKLISDIQPLINLTRLACQCCPLIGDISSLINLTELHCSMCPRISNIHTLTKLTRLTCQDCPSIDNIQTLTNLTRLICDDCPLIDNVKPLTKLVHLQCSKCKNISDLSNLINLESLNCQKCHRLTDLSNLINLVYLDCQECSHLVDLSNLINLKQLYCSNCVNLIKLPILTDPLCVYFKNCPKIQIVEDTKKAIKKIHDDRLKTIEDEEKVYTRINKALDSISSVHEIKQLEEIVCKTFHKYLQYKETEYVDIANALCSIRDKFAETEFNEARTEFTNASKMVEELLESDCEIAELNDAVDKVKLTYDKFQILAESKDDSAYRELIVEFENAIKKCLPE